MPGQCKKKMKLAVDNAKALAYIVRSWSEKGKQGTTTDAKMKLIESYCRGQVGLYEETLTDGSKVYYIQTCGSAFIPVRTMEDGMELCKAFVKYTM